MLRILFIAHDLAATRFLPEPAPSLEVKFAVAGLRRGIHAPWGERWRGTALAAVPIAARPVVRQLGEHFSWALSPTFAVSTDLDEALDTGLGGLDRERVREEMALFHSAPTQVFRCCSGTPSKGTAQPAG